MSEAALEKVQLERDGLAKELQLVQSAIPKDKVRATVDCGCCIIVAFSFVGDTLRSCLHGINRSRFLLFACSFHSPVCAGR